VTWINNDDEPHTVVQGDKLFKSHALDTGDKFSFTFSTPGAFKYFCTIHAHMVGTVVVAASQQSQWVGRTQRPAEWADLWPIRRRCEE
jgi:hypothetical protein